MKKRVFSGIQPTGNLHLGNYLGAIRRWVDAQSQYDNLFCIVDLHAITVPQDPRALRAKSREVVALLFAAGIEPDQSAVFIQSHIGAHAELAWILNCYIPMGWMQRMTQFKEKSQRQKGQVSVGLFDYPALMAADILLYETDLVPVGGDQKQHVELTRDVAQHFNSVYGDVFKLPEPLMGEVGARIMSLDNPTKKMSKSETGKGHALNLLDTPDEIRAKIMSATTDSLREIRFDPDRPAVTNLLTIYELFSGLSRTAIEQRFAGKGYAELKQELADVVIEHLKPLQARYRVLADDPSHLDHLLTEGASRVQPIAEKTVTRVKVAIGLG
ncbi:MAG: tryptophan--tRNA ligase [Anaerolineae bacterium UTCFX2]|nr:tryptophan--tRNA ligase [Anaerolineales bacterium]OQY91670.1 MAG: tryptophan--tRNA ligase [Anaerolineae bacterium UTCFX2]